MSESNALNKLFGSHLWKSKRPILWCDLCNTAIISCDECSGTTCNAHACEKCAADFDDFNTAKTTVFEYLTDDEKKVFEKCLRIKHFIIESLSQGDYKIDWHKLDSLGKLSQNDRAMFLSETK